MRIFYALLIALTCVADICKVYVCKKSSERPTDQTSETYCLREQTASENKYQIYAFNDACNASIHIISKPFLLRIPYC
jgi:hypothetical protein